MQPRNEVVTALMLAAFVVTIMLSGCGERVTKENYDKIQTGMSLAQVEEILGKGAAKGSGGANIGALSVSGGSYEWQSNGKTISIVVLNDKVMTKMQSGL